MLKGKELRGLAKLPAGSKVFLGDMTDIFHSDVSWEMLTKVFDAMAGLPKITFQVLTKRPGRMAYFANEILTLGCMVGYGSWGWPPNVWAGTSVESQKYAPRLDVLARVPAKVRFVSVEPMLGPVDLRPYFFKCSGACVPTPEDPICACKGLAIHQIIVGGESGPGARPMDLAWARDLVAQCQHTGAACFVKQLGAKPYTREPLHYWNGEPAGFRDDRLYLKDRKGGDPEEWPTELRVREFP